MRTGFYAGSFDPMTNGHLDVLVQAFTLCDRIVIGVGTSATKKPMFSFEERRTMMALRTVAVPVCGHDFEGPQPCGDAIGRLSLQGTGTPFNHFRGALPEAHEVGCGTRV